MKRMIKSSNDWDKELHEYLKGKDTSDWAEMQTERQQRDIDRAGGYDKYIKQERKKRNSSY